MCGIAGKCGTGERPRRGAVTAMTAHLVHRGPDAFGIVDAGTAALGIARLAVIDVDHGDQPLHSEDGAVSLVLNGEIYNHEELRRELRRRGHAFATGSDAEVVVHLWEELGERCVDPLRGMFAFAIWDRRERKLFLARDRLGKKPLWYHLVGGELGFASEVGALLRDPAVGRRLEPEAIDAYLANGYVPGELSALRGIRKLPSASTLSWHPGRPEPEPRRYWSLDYEPKLRIGRAEAAERLRELLLDATRIRLRSDVPLGAFLSGGIDSSAVVAAMTITGAGPVRTFAAAFGERDYDERLHAREVARHLGTEHLELEIGGVDLGLLERLSARFGEPFADPAAVANHQLAELTVRHVTVALSGDGGDEAFAGYWRHRRMRQAQAAEWVPGPARAAVAAGLGAAVRGERGSRLVRLAALIANPPGRRYAELGRWFSAGDRERLYGPALLPQLERNPLRPVERAWNDRAGLGPVDRATATDLETYLADDLLTKADITSMASSLEVRSPLLDHRLLEFAARLPEHLKLRGREGKVLLREAARPWLPPATVARPKHGFAVPIAEWLRGPLAEPVADLLLDRRARERELFVPAAVERTLAEHRDGADRSKQLWAMLNLELWLRSCVEAPPARLAPAPAQPLARVNVIASEAESPVAS